MTPHSTDDPQASYRVLFCIGVQPPNFAANETELKELFEALKQGFDDLEGRFGLKVLGTFDDDQLMVGASSSFPWTSYILADVPDVSVAVEVCGLLRQIRVGEHRLWHYLRIEARLGRALFFGNR